MAGAASARIIELPERGKRLTALAERAYTQIKQMVLDNRVHGGEYLLEEDLARGGDDRFVLDDCGPGHE
jgi:hypothetical protein